MSVKGKPHLFFTFCFGRRWIPTADSKVVNMLGDDQKMCWLGVILWTEVCFGRCVDLLPAIVDNVEVVMKTSDEAGDGCGEVRLVETNPDET